MFTGIVEEMGSLAEVSPQSHAFTMRFNAAKVLEGTQIGDSIAVNGTCLTVTAFDTRRFSVDVAPETRSRTNLAQLKPGDPVNLERAVTPSTRLGGHIVQGHVDGVGKVTAMRPDGEALWITVAAAPEILHYIVPKGFICLDGVSLTVVDVDAAQFTLMLVPHTQKTIILARKAPGYLINIEVDIVGKYVEKFVAGPIKSGLTLDSLRDHGFA